MPTPVSQTCSSSLLAAAARAADQHAAVVGVADRVGDQVAHDALDQQRVGVGVSGGRRGCAAPGPSRTPIGSKCSLTLRNTSSSWKSVGPRLDAAGVDLGDVEQLGEQAVERVDRFVDAVDQLRRLVVVAALAQRLGEQARARAAAGAGRGWRRRRTASWRGWRPRPRGAPPRRPRFRRAAGPPARSARALSSTSSPNASR